MLVSLSINSLEMYSRDISVIEIAHESNEANGVKGRPDTSKERLCCKARFAHQHKAKSRKVSIKAGYHEATHSSSQSIEPLRSSKDRGSPRFL